MNFIEAMKLLSKGQKVRYKYWLRDDYIYMNDDKEVLNKKEGEYSFSFDDLITKMWIVCLIY